MKASVAVGNSVPETCPEGHAREAADEFAEAPEETGRREVRHHLSQELGTAGRVWPAVLLFRR
jgi:hypothetical protein